MRDRHIRAANNFFIKHKCNFLNLKVQITSLDENSDIYHHRNPGNVPGNICIISSDKSSPITSNNNSSRELPNDNRNNVSKFESDESYPPLCKFVQNI